MARRGKMNQSAFCYFAICMVSAYLIVIVGNRSRGMVHTVVWDPGDDPAVPREWAPTVPCKPSFMVIGAPRSGTTSLWYNLEAHSQVHRPARHQLCFFSEFKRHLDHLRAGQQTPADLQSSTSWPHYQAGIAGPPVLHARKDLYKEGTPSERSEREATWTHAVSDAAAECSTQQAFEVCPFYLGEPRVPGLLYRTFPQLRVVAVLRNPRDRTVSAFNDRMAMAASKVNENEANGWLEKLIGHTVALVASGNRSLEDFDVRVLTSGVYIHGLRSWGEVWPTQQLLVLRSEDMFADAVGVMDRVQDFLQLPRAIRSSRMQADQRRRQRVASRYSHLKAKPSRNVNATLDAFFAPYNAQLYAWMEAQGRDFTPWDQPQGYFDSHGGLYGDNSFAWSY